MKGTKPLDIVWVCDECGGENIQIKVWADPNTSQICGDAGEWNHCYCVDCDGPQRLQSKGGDA